MAQGSVVVIAMAKGIDGMGGEGEATALFSHERNVHGTLLLLLLLPYISLSVQKKKIVRGEGRVRLNPPNLPRSNMMIDPHVLLDNLPSLFPMGYPKHHDTLST